MKRKKLRRTGNDRLTGQVGGEVDAYNVAEIELQKNSANYYERRWRDRKKDRAADIVIAIGLYLILASVAFVVL